MARLMSRMLDSTTRLIRSLDRCMSDRDVAELIGMAVKPFGAEYLFAGTMPQPHAPARQQLRNVMLNSMPEEWGHRYFSRGFLEIDPTIQAVKALQPVTAWSGLDRRGNVVMDEATEFGLRDGVTFSHLTLDRECAGFSFAGDQLDDCPESIAQMRLLSAFAIARLLELREVWRPDEHRRLTTREVETLRWIAEGKTDWEIGMILGISQKGVEKATLRVRQKLCALNRTHATAIAFREGLL